MSNYNTDTILAKLGDDLSDLAKTGFYSTTVMGPACNAGTESESQSDSNDFTTALLNDEKIQEALAQVGSAATPAKRKAVEDKASALLSVIAGVMAEKRKNS